ncbi:chromosome segregation protein SMC [Levilactobacillus acidifarinae]|uniref:Chromosome partition protein Smc n=1 Tax=Levilactobacillus acidifarinae DSM 19394 = JCM 15949 TaxID=1423715 RepID=A0A0R1LMS7_9LACO|nr:chromosome segregation protein SMC [Levilactobacillus acidifarinae]KRK94372.1 chromosome segregation ATPase [Levilactobacillus acidifarinae DSM 19394]GEO68112.1 chromosome partition protein Smc [Levilactobacillus acidifarinae]
MRLKTLEISGFKSFADKTRIDFLPGMTGIVGPNGSGKSNIAEAVRWVLGEQSAKSLRGTKMPDIIFGGSADRHALNRASVEITLDNSDHYLKSAYTELTLSRRLYRTGESEYLINGQSCRLKDITELLMDSGMGQDSFSIISQGRVAAIFNSKPEDRRSIVEEVAGVYKYRKHKERAERELDETMGNLHRVEDIIAELEGRLKPLEEQSDLAQDYLAQKKRFEELDRTQLVRQLHAEMAQKADLDKEVRQKKGLVHEQQYAQQQHGQKVQALQQQQQTLLKQKDDLQAQLVTATKLVEQRQGQVNLSGEQRRNQATQQARLAQELVTTKQRVQDLTQSIATETAAIKDLEATIKAHQAEIKTLQAATAEQVIDQLRERLESLRTAYFDQKQQVAAWRNQRQYLQQDQARQQERGKRLTAQLSDLQATAQATQQAASDLKAQATAAHDQLSQAEQANDAEAGQYQAHQQQYRQLQRNWQAALEVYQRAKTQAASQQAAVTEYGGFYQGVRAILRQRDRFTGLLGAVSELLKVPKDYTTAIEYALGGQLQQVVVTDEATAKQAVQYLRENRAGRATFLPVTTVRQRQLDATTRRQLAGLDGFVGVGSDLVTITSNAQPILNYLLGTTILATDLDAAVALSRQIHHRYRVVSLAGDVVSASGAITGGQARQSHTSVLRQRQELEQLQTSLTSMEAQLRDQETKVKAQRDALQASEQRSQALQTQLNALHPQCRQLDDQLAAAQTAANQAKRQLQAAQVELQQTTGSAEGTTDAELQAKMTQGQAAIAQQETNLKALQAQIKTESDHQATQRQTLTTKQTWVAGAVERQQQQRQTLRQHQADLQTAQANQQQLVQEQAQLAQQEGVTPAEAAAQLKAAQAQQQTTKQALATANDRLAQVNDQLETANTANDRATGLLQVANDDLKTAQVNQTRIDALIDQQQNQLSEKYHLSLAAAEADLSDLPADQLAVQLKLLKRGLAEIGTVNLNAIDEYQDVRERYDFLTQQRDDLLTAKDQLTATMSELDDQVKHRFKTSFDQIATKFTATFKQMFNGGTAELVLTAPDDLLTTGIDIMAQPPGKKFQNMGLLSGGERALTAITLLFAILQVQPVPFCILDEVEAALDPANVTRFARYIHQFQAQTQFIVITHRKETMVQADVLYGVTMQESGVSKMVAVDLNQDSETTAEGKQA